MNSYATASMDAKDSIACLQSYHRAGFVDYGRLYQPPSQSAVYLDQYRLAQPSAYPTDHDPSGPYPVVVGGKSTAAAAAAAAAAAYEVQSPAYGFFDLPETFRRDQWPLLQGSTAAVHDPGNKRLDSGGGELSLIHISEPTRPY